MGQMAWPILKIVIVSLNLNLNKNVNVKLNFDLIESYHMPLNNVFILRWCLCFLQIK